MPIVTAAQSALTIIGELTRVFIAVANAPDEVNGIQVELEALSTCLKAFLDEAESDGSIFSTVGSQDVLGLNKLLQRLIGNLGQIERNVTLYTTNLGNTGTRTWKQSVRSTAARLSWTAQGGSIKDLLKSLRSDFELVNNVVIAIQSKALGEMHRALATINPSLDRIESKIDNLQEEMRHHFRNLAGGPQGSLYTTFGYFDDPPAYEHNDPSADRNSSSMSANTEQGPGIPPTIQGRSRSMRQSTLGSALASIVRADELNVTATEFFWRLAAQAAFEMPWKGGVRMTDTYPDKRSAEHHLSNCVGSLIELADYDNVWKDYSINSWLCIGAWYLAKARYVLKVADEENKQSLFIESFASLVKVYWILLTIDQHPQKPLTADAGQPDRHLEQLQFLSSATFTEINNADRIIGRQPLQGLAETFERDVGSFWEDNSWSDEQADEEQFLASFASSILENPAFVTAVVKSEGIDARRGKYIPLCRNCFFILPKCNEHIPRQPAFLACACADSVHLTKLRRFRFSESSTWSYFKSKETQLELKGVIDRNDSSASVDLVLVFPMAEIATLYASRMRSVGIRIKSRGTSLGSWPISYLQGPLPTSLRLVRSPFDNAPIGAPFQLVLGDGRSPKTRRRKVVRKERVPTASERREQRAQRSILSVFQSIFGKPMPSKTYDENVSESETDEETDSSSLPMSKPPDSTQPKPISPLTLRMNWSSKDSLIFHLIGPKNRFEMILADARLILRRNGYNAMSCEVFSSSACEGAPIMKLTLCWKVPSDIDIFGRLLAFHRTRPLHKFDFSDKIVWERVLTVGIGSVDSEMNVAILPHSLQHQQVCFLMWQAGDLDDWTLCFVDKTTILEPSTGACLTLPATIRSRKGPPPTGENMLVNISNTLGVGENTESEEDRCRFVKSSATSITVYEESCRDIFEIVSETSVLIFHQDLEVFEYKPKKIFGLKSSSKTPRKFELAMSLGLRLCRTRTANVVLYIFGWKVGQPSGRAYCKYLYYNGPLPEMKFSGCRITLRSVEFSCSPQGSSLSSPTLSPSASTSGHGWMGDFVLEFPDAVALQGFARCLVRDTNSNPPSR